MRVVRTLRPLVAVEQAGAAFLEVLVEAIHAAIDAGAQTDALRERLEKLQQRQGLRRKLRRGNDVIWEGLIVRLSIRAPM